MRYQNTGRDLVHTTSFLAFAQNGTVRLEKIRKQILGNKVYNYIKILNRHKTFSSFNFCTILYEKKNFVNFIKNNKEDKMIIFYQIN